MKNKKDQKRIRDMIEDEARYSKWAKASRKKPIKEKPKELLFSDIEAAIFEEFRWLSRKEIGNLLYDTKFSLPVITEEEYDLCLLYFKAVMMDYKMPITSLKKFVVLSAFVYARHQRIANTPSEVKQHIDDIDWQ